MLDMITASRHRTLQTQLCFALLRNSSSTYPAIRKIFPKDWKVFQDDVIEAWPALSKTGQLVDSADSV